MSLFLNTARSKITIQGRIQISVDYAENPLLQLIVRITVAKACHAIKSKRRRHFRGDRVENPAK